MCIRSAHAFRAIKCARCAGGNIQSVELVIYLTLGSSLWQTTDSVLHIKMGKTLTKYLVILPKPDKMAAHRRFHGRLWSMRHEPWTMAIDRRDTISHKTCSVYRYIKPHQHYDIALIFTHCIQHPYRTVIRMMSNEQT